jgi:hypothetical protein
MHCPTSPGLALTKKHSLTPDFRTESHSGFQFGVESAGQGHRDPAISIKNIPVRPVSFTSSSLHRELVSIAIALLNHEGFAL